MMSGNDLPKVAAGAVLYTLESHLDTRLEIELAFLDRTLWPEISPHQPLLVHHETVKVVWPYSRIP